MSAPGFLAVLSVSVWLLATILYQLAPFQGRIGRLDGLKLLPSWSFFAPSPANRDSHIVVRELLSDGALSAWSPVCFFPSRSLLDLLWNPAKRPRKILRDAAKSIRHTARRSLSRNVVQCSLPYLVILHHCLMQRSRAQSAVAVQFAVVDTSGREERRLWITFISEFHRL
jgi:hypothetical protein